MGMGDAFDVVAAEAEGVPRVLVIAGTPVRLVEQPAVGALIVFTRRLQSKNPMDQITAVVKLIEAWVVKEDHEALYDALEHVVDIEEFMEKELPKLVEEATSRPTSAPASSHAF